MLYFKKIIWLKDVGLMIFCYTLEGFMSLEECDFIKLVYFFL